MSKSKYPNFDPNGVGLLNGHFIGLPFTEADANVVILSIPWDLTVSYAAGTATGPENILNVSSQLDLYDSDFENAWQVGLYLRPSSIDWLTINNNLRHKAEDYIRFLEEGGKVEQNPGMTKILSEINLQCESLQQYVYEESVKLLKANKRVAILGGEHSVPFGFFRALAEREHSFGILQIDAHMDLREAYENFKFSHASIFWNALKLPEVSKLVQVGIRDSCEAEWKLVESSEGRIVVFPDQELKESKFEGQEWDHTCEEIIAHLPDKVYISFDIDGLDPKLCPNTGTPVPGGMQLEEVFYLIKKLMLSGRELIGFDLCEVAGDKHEWDGNVGARILYKLANWLGSQS